METVTDGATEIDAPLHCSGRKNWNCKEVNMERDVKTVHLNEMGKNADEEGKKARSKKNK